MTIGALAGVEQADAGIASGLINTSQQVGGSIGVALATTIATTYTARYVAAHTGVTASSAAALVHGFSAAFYVLGAIAAVAAILAAIMLEPKSTHEPVRELATAETAA